MKRLLLLGCLALALSCTDSNDDNGPRDAGSQSDAATPSDAGGQGDAQPGDGGTCVPTCAAGQGCGNDGCNTDTCGICAANEICRPDLTCAVPAPETYLAVVNDSETISNCMAPCAVQFDVQAAENLSWAQVRDGRFIWNFDDGGSTADSEGFLAATVYETPGTYQPTVTVNGQTWTAQTIQVTAPDWVGCVSPPSLGVGRFDDCPDSTHHYDDLNAALGAASGSFHVLLDRASAASYGNLPENAGKPSMIGAYGAEVTLPKVGTADARPRSNWRYVDLDITVSGDAGIGFVNGFGVLLLRVNSHGTTKYNHMAADDGFFLIDSRFRGNDYVLIGGDVVRPTAKGSTFVRTVEGQSTFRMSGGKKELYQNCSFDCDGCGSQIGLTIRANTDWVLVQGNTFLENAGAAADAGDPNVTHRYIIWERNLYDLRTAEQNFQNAFSMRDSVIRNNVLLDPASGGAGVAIAVGTVSGEDSGNVWVTNNTIIQSNPDKMAVLLDCVLGGCVNKNNLMFSTGSSFDKCFSGGTLSNNWCYSSNYCLNPNGSTTPCSAPSFVSTDPTSADFARPAANTVGINAGDQTVPVFDDYFGAPRSMIDVGAVER